ncbi:hypothetical protein SEA_DALANDE_52 [Gordonia phage DalanDe]|nr:hypothetical protein SEA_DALANDE_52 [Gordonia phage DalanDe]
MAYSVTTERLYDKLPDIYRETDVAHDLQFKKFIASTVDVLGDIDLLVERFRYRSQIEMEMRKRYAQRNTIYTHPGRSIHAPALGSTSDLVDPTAADAKWLPWLGQLIGVKIDPNESEAVNRDSIRYASSGFRAGSKDALEKAVRGVLTGSKYAVAMPHTKVNQQGFISAGTTWDITILTRAQESPSSYVVLQSVNKDTLKPAGVMLYHKTYEASWDALEASLPYWRDWETLVWDEIEQVGVSYVDIAGNLIPNPSFETDTAGWTVGGSASMTRVGGGVDGSGRLRFEHQGGGTKTLTSPEFPLTANEGYVYGFTYQGTQPFVARLLRGSTEVATLDVPASVNTNRRVNSGIMPTQAGNYKLELRFTTGAVNDYSFFDGFVVRKA